jgi:hypothetical protein
MTPRPTHLLDQDNNRVALPNVTHTGAHYEGTISLEQTPPQLKQLFEEYEEVIEGQMFSLLDRIEEKVGGIPFKVSFDDGTVACVDDLQIFPSTGAVSFKTRQRTRV